MIKGGSVVNIYWEHVPAEFGVKVACMPSRPGGVWILQREDGTEVNVSSFCKMEEVKPSSDKG